MVEQTDNYIEIKPGLVIPASDLKFQFSRSGGPGGQNVNKRETRVELTFDVRGSGSFSEEQRSRLLWRLARRLDSQGVLHIVVDTQRSQLQNRQEAVLRFTHVLRQGLRVTKLRRATRPSRAVIERRLTSKRKRSETKNQRRPAQAPDAE